MKKIICLLAAVILLNGCALFHHRRKDAAPSKPKEETSDFNFKTNPKDEGKMFQKIGLTYFKQRDQGRAKYYLSKAVNLDPSLYYSWYCLGLLDIDSQEGGEDLKKSAELKPDFLLVYYWMGYHYCRTREDRKAIASYKKYIELAEGISGEEDRLGAAIEVLRELSSGKDGRALAMIR